MAIGRPKLAPQDRHSETVRIPLRPSDHVRLQSMADKAETTITDFVRAAALGQKFTVVQSTAPDFETVEQLRRIGVNLNQIAKAMNAQETVQPSELIDACNAVQTVLAKWMFDDPTNHHRPKL